jgi:hypothetical protein
MQHVYGQVVGDRELGGLLETVGCVFVTSYTVIHAELETESDSSVIGCEISGRINGSDDTINTVYLLSPSEAGALVRGIMLTVDSMDAAEQTEFIRVMENRDGPENDWWDM